MFESLKNHALDKWNNLSDSLRGKIREKAIENAKNRILINQKKVEDFSQDELEIFVKEEEDKIKEAIKTKSLFAALAFLGIGII